MLSFNSFVKYYALWKLYLMFYAKKQNTTYYIIMLIISYAGQFSFTITDNINKKITKVLYCEIKTSFYYYYFFLILMAILW